MEQIHKKLFLWRRFTRRGSEGEKLKVLVKVHKKESLKKKLHQKVQYNSGEVTCGVIIKSPGKDFDKSPSEAFDDPEK